MSSSTATGMETVLARCMAWLESAGAAAASTVAADAAEAAGCVCWPESAVCCCGGLRVRDPRRSLARLAADCSRPSLAGSERRRSLGSGRVLVPGSRCIAGPLARRRLSRRLLLREGPELEPAPEPWPVAAAALSVPAKRDSQLTKKSSSSTPPSEVAHCSSLATLRKSSSGLAGRTSK